MYKIIGYQKEVYNIKAAHFNTDEEWQKFLNKALKPRHAEVVNLRCPADQLQRKSLSEIAGILNVCTWRARCIFMDAFYSLKTSLNLNPEGKHDFGSFNEHTKLGALGLPNRALNPLFRNGYKTLGDLLDENHKNRYHSTGYKNCLRIGQKSIEEIQKILNEFKKNKGGDT